MATTSDVHERLEALARGSWTHDGRELVGKYDAHSHAAWVPSAAHALKRLDALAAVRCIPRQSGGPLWIHVAGDSSMRFLFGALLSLFNGSEPREIGFPSHWMNDTDKVRRVPLSLHDSTPCSLRHALVRLASVSPSHAVRLSDWRLEHQ